MKKIMLLLATLTIPLSLLQLQGCEKNRLDPDFDAEAMMKKEEFESIMDGKRQWKIGSMTSDLPRELEYVEFNLETFEFDTVRSVSTDWLSQLSSCNNDDPITLTYSGYTNMYGVENPDNISIRTDQGVGEKCYDGQHETYFTADARSVVKFDQYEAKLYAVHSRFYGYVIPRSDTITEEDKRELWTNFKAAPDMISYEVNKTYEGRVYHVKVTLVPLE